MKRIKLTAFLLCIIMSVASLSVVQVCAANDYENHWARAQITELLNKKIVSGYEDGSVKPNNNISRAEFVTLINKLFGYTKESSEDFNDVAESKWYLFEFRKAKAAGYLTGDQYGNANPDSAITRAEVCVIAAKVLNLNGVEKTGFTDDAFLPQWAKSYIGAMSATKLINGYPDGSFGASGNITRAEAFVIIYNMLNRNETEDNSEIPTDNNSAESAEETDQELADKLAARPVTEISKQIDDYDRFFEGAEVKTDPESISEAYKMYREKADRMLNQKEYGADYYYMGQVSSESGTYDFRNDANSYVRVKNHNEDNEEFMLTYTPMTNGEGEDTLTYYKNGTAYYKEGSLKVKYPNVKPEDFDLKKLDILAKLNFDETAIKSVEIGSQDIRLNLDPAKAELSGFFNASKEDILCINLIFALNTEYEGEFVVTYKIQTDYESIINTGKTVFDSGYKKLADYENFKVYIDNIAFAAYFDFGNTTVNPLDELETYKTPEEIAEEADSSGRSGETSYYIEDPK